jgi:hypothetical protein
MLLTPQRRLLLSPWIWVGGAIAFLIFLPNLLWNIQHHFPFLELQANIRRSERNIPLSPLAFFGQEVLTCFLSLSPSGLPASVFSFSQSRAKPFRALGWAWVFTAAVIVTLSPRVYYLYPAFPVLLARGSVMWEAWLDRPQYHSLKLVYPVILKRKAR